MHSIKTTLKDSHGKVQVQGQLIEASDIEGSLRQGKALSTVMFNTVLEIMIRNNKTS
jgi:hypothetical protein